MHQVKENVTQKENDWNKIQIWR